MVRIIVIDDDEDVRSLIAAALEAAGYEVRVAANGEQGLAAQRAAPADVVVTDIFMPEKEGIETIRELKEEFPEIKIIAISGGGEPRKRGRSFTAHDVSVVAGELGVRAILQKPFAASELLSSIDAALAER